MNHCSVTFQDDIARSRMAREPVDVILDRAADLIDARGWVQRSYVGPYGQLCVMGAISYAMYGGMYGDAFQDRVVRPMVHYTGCHCDLPEWNDHPRRTKEEVTSALRTVAMMLRTTGTVTPMPKEEPQPEMWTEVKVTWTDEGIFEEISKRLQLVAEKVVADILEQRQESKGVQHGSDRNAGSDQRNAVEGGARQRLGSGDKAGHSERIEGVRSERVVEECSTA